MTQIPPPKQRRKYAVQVLTDDKKDKLDEAAFLILGNLDWEETKEGDDFWCAVYERLHAISLGERP